MSNKPFLDYEGQINKLLSKELEIKNKDEALKILKRVGYYQLISGYKTMFKNAAGYYIDGVEFNDIVSLYYFDEGLRNLFLEYILKIERTICSHISYYFCNKFGNSQHCYLEPRNYNPRASHHELTKLLNTIRYYSNRDMKHKYIKHYREHHGNVPLWVVINALSIGNISVLYACLQDDIKSKISKEYAYVNEADIEAMLRSLTKFRNLCAHGERLYNERIGNAIPNTNIHQKLEIEITNGQYKYGKKDLFSVLISCKYLLPKKDFNQLKRKLEKLIQSYFNRPDSFLKVENILEKMGFPSNWTKITRYKN